MPEFITEPPDDPTKAPQAQVRLTFNIDRDIWDVLAAHIPWGMRKHVYRAVIEGLAKQLTKDHVRTLAAMVHKTWDLGTALGLPKEDEDGGSA